jgi:hypothetical protein
MIKRKKQIVSDAEYEIIRRKAQAVLIFDLEISAPSKGVFLFLGGFVNANKSCYYRNYC